MRSIGYTRVSPHDEDHDEFNTATAQNSSADSQRLIVLPHHHSNSDNQPIVPSATAAAVVGDNDNDRIIIVTDGPSQSQSHSQLQSHSQQSSMTNAVPSAADTIDREQSREESGSQSQSQSIDEEKDFVSLLQVGVDKRDVLVSFEWDVSLFRHRYFSDALNSDKNVRLIYCGQMLNDGRTLASYKVKKGAFIHVAISEYRGTQSQPGYNPKTFNDSCEDGFIPDEQLARMIARRENNEGTTSETQLDTSDIGALIRNVNAQRGAMGDDETNRAVDTTDFACGFFMGLMFGVWVFFLIAFNRRYGRSRRFRFGVLLGVIVNLIMDALTTNNKNDGIGE